MRGFHGSCQEPDDRSDREKICALEMRAPAESAPFLRMTHFASFDAVRPEVGVRYLQCLRKYPGHPPGALTRLVVERRRADLPRIALNALTPLAPFRCAATSALVMVSAGYDCKIGDAKKPDARSYAYNRSRKCNQTLLTRLSSIVSPVWLFPPVLSSSKSKRGFRA